MPRENRTYAIAEAINSLFVAGNVDPSVAEIAHEHYGSTVIGKAEIGIVRRALPAARRVLEEEFDQIVYLVNASYYRRNRLGKFGANRKVPATSTDARKCLPLGHAVRAEGIHLVTDGDDLIWVESLRQGGAVAAGHVKRIDNNHGKGLTRGVLSEATALGLRGEMTKAALPDSQEAIERLKALPPVQ